MVSRIVTISPDGSADIRAARNALLELSGVIAADILSDTSVKIFKGERLSDSVLDSTVTKTGAHVVSITQ